MVEQYAELLVTLRESTEISERADLLARLGGPTIKLEGGADTVVDLLSGAAEEASGDSAPYFAMLLGLALHARYRAAGAADDLDAGTSALAASLGRVPVGTPWRCVAVADLVGGLRLRAGRLPDESGELLSRAIELGEEELTFNAEDPAFTVLIANVALACHDRWSLAGQTDDASRAIRYLRAWFDDPGPMGDEAGDLLPVLGRLLVDRSYRRGDAADAEQAVVLLASEEWLDGEDAVTARLHYTLGKALLACWELGGPDCLPDAFDSFTEALRYVDDDELSLSTAHERIIVAAHLHFAGMAGFGTPQLRQLVDEAAARLHATISPAAAAKARLGIILAIVDGLVLSPPLSADDVHRVRGLLALAEDADLEPHWRGMASNVLEYLAAQTGDARPGHLRNDALTLLLTGGYKLSAEREAEIAEGVASMLYERSKLHGDLRGEEVAVTMLREAAERRSAIDLAGFVQATMDEALHRLRQGDRAAFTAGMRRAADLVAAAPEPSSVPPDLARTVEMIAHLSEALGQEMTEVPSFNPLPFDTPSTPEELRPWGVLMHVKLIYACHVGDIAVLREIARSAGALLSDQRVDLGERRLSLLQTAGAAELEVTQLDPVDSDAARRAVELYAEACALAGGPQHPDWAVLAYHHALTLRHAGGPGERAASRQIGRSALYGHAWRVLLQSGTDYAMRAAQSAAALALKVATWCAADARSDPAALDELVAVLDLGRGQVLRAATVSRNIPDQLTDAGYPDLAHQWRTATVSSVMGTVATDLGTVPDALRLQVLHALHPDSVEQSALLSTVGVRDICDALEAVDADALMYLVPGFAVLVSPLNGVEVLHLPGLEADVAMATHERFAATRAGRDLAPSAPEDRSTFELLCDWAWHSVVEPLLAHLGSSDGNRPSRIVLIPTGTLGLVPWHAAFDAAAAVRRYAVEDVVLTYAVSAEMFCASARHYPRRPESALIVGDPGKNLPFADLEARAVHGAFHPNGTYLENATADDVLRWLAARDGEPAAVHFACHGRVDTALPAEAELVLHGGTLTVRRIIEESRHDELRLDQVVLAACSTGVTGHDHDEAVSVATTFLAAGARTVISSMWIIPDAATSLLMFMLHHYLWSEGLEPAAALRAAQLWMLDPARKPPFTMPPALASQAGQATLADPLSWAAFTHSGR